jgi:hypothetical protein
MMKWMTAAMFTMLATLSVAGARTDAPAPSAASTTSTIEAPSTAAFDACFPAYDACTAECKLLVGGAKGACLRMCRADYDDCRGL